jgi:hypothetical protein
MSETYPPEGEQNVGVLPPEMDGPSDPASAMPEPPSKPKLHWGFALLGFAATGVLSVGITYGAAAVGSLSASTVALSIIGPITGLLEVAIFAGMVIAWVIGRDRDNRLRSFGIGGLLTYLVVVLVSLLAVGACFVSLGTGQ